MNEFGMNPSNTDTVRRWMAERENADARLELARVRECCKLLVSQYDPVSSLGIDRERLAVLLDFVQHHDTSRLRRECEALMIDPATEHKVGCVRGANATPEVS